MKIKVVELEKLVKNCLVKKYDREDANLISEVVLFGELSGKTSHGIVRINTGGSSVMAQNPTGKPLLTRRTGFSFIIDGNGNPGMLVGQLAVKEVISIAKKSGFGI